MERYDALITVGEGATCYTVTLPPELAGQLALQGAHSVALRFGTRRVQVSWEVDPTLNSGIRVSRPLAQFLGLPAGVRLSLWREGRAQLALGPLLGYVTSRAVLRALQAGEELPSFTSMAAAAREIGALLIFFGAQDIQWDTTTVRAGWIETPAGSPWRLVDGSFPLPRVMLYPTAVTGAPTPRQLAAQVRSVGGKVLSHRKIRKLETYDILRKVPEVQPYLVYTERLSMDSLTHALHRYDDLYLKPDDLYRGKGVHRLVRRRTGGWVLTQRAPVGNVGRVLPDLAAVRRAVAPMLRSRSVYLIQEGLPLATFMGNRFDLRALAQRDGTGRWAVSGLVARIAPLGSPITSPRSGGRVALPELVFEHVFGTRGRNILANVEEATRTIARAMDAALGPLYEFGIDLAVLDDGSVRLIEVNGMPLKVSLHRLNDPLANERIDRYPVHYAAWLEIRGNWQ